MPELINFVRDRQRQLSKQEVQDRVWFRYSLVGFGIATFLAVVAIGADLGVNWQMNKVKDQQAAMKRVVLSQEDVEKSYVIFANKLKVLKDIFIKRSNKQVAIRFFATAFGSEVLVKEIRYQADEGLLAFGLRAQTVFTLQEVFARLDSAEVRDQFPKLNKSELRRQSDGSYEVVITVELPTTAEKSAPTPVPEVDEVPVEPG